MYCAQAGQVTVVNCCACCGVAVLLQQRLDALRPCSNELTRPPGRLPSQCSPDRTSRRCWHMCSFWWGTFRACPQSCTPSAHLRATGRSRTHPQRHEFFWESTELAHIKRIPTSCGESQSATTYRGLRWRCSHCQWVCHLPSNTCRQTLNKQCGPRRLAFRGRHEKFQANSCRRMQAPSPAPRPLDAQPVGAERLGAGKVRLDFLLLGLAVGAEHDGTDVCALGLCSSSVGSSKPEVAAGGGAVHYVALGWQTCAVCGRNGRAVSAMELPLCKS